MQTTEGMTPDLSKHAIKMATEKGFTAEQIKSAFHDPNEVYPSGSHPGQFRVTGYGVCLVGVPKGNTFKVITLYADRVLTPPRPDQLDTPEGRRYAARFAAGQGRG